MEYVINIYQLKDKTPDPYSLVCYKSKDSDWKFGHLMVSPKLWLDENRYSEPAEDTDLWCELPKL